MFEKSPERTVPTIKRYSLVRSGVIEGDFITGTKDQGRELVVPSVSGYLQKIRTALLSERLTLGVPADMVGNSDKNVFYIPLESRPLGLEAATTARGADVYSDHAMMRELGQTLGAVGRIADGRVLVGPNVEDVFALTDYVAPNERQLYLVPGAEQRVSNAVQLNPLEAQMQQFGVNFEARYRTHADAFVQGYQEGFGGQ